LVVDALESWYRKSARDLPWRRTRDPYAIWLSEVMLQQTQVDTVIPYYERFLKQFPTVEALAAAELPEVLALWKGLGYYARARNLHKAAKIVVSKHEGKLPSEPYKLRALPGFGPYTTGAVASIAFGERAPIVDGNVVRVLARLFSIVGDPSNREVQGRFWSHAQRAVFVAKEPGAFNQALMELGATVCVRSKPTCLLCPVSKHCHALKHGQIEQLPSPKNKPVRKKLHWTAVVVQRGNKLLLARRLDEGLFGGLWELPSAEGDAQALQSRLGTHFQLAEVLDTVERTLTHRDLSIELVRGRFKGTVPKFDGYQEARWVTAEQLKKLGVSTAMSACIARVWPEASSSVDSPS
jgi:A/G-specific adenine glycosylase